MSDLIYLASPYTHEDAGVMEMRFEMACTQAVEMMGAGMIVFSPIAHCHPLSDWHDLPGDWEYWQRFDEAILKACGKLVVLKLDGYEHSAGIAAEVMIAKRLGIPVEWWEFGDIQGEKL